MKQLAGCGLGQCPSVFEAPDNGFYVIGLNDLFTAPRELANMLQQGESLVYVSREVGLEFARTVLADKAAGSGEDQGWL